MQFTGRNLFVVRDALMHAISSVEMDIGSCPDVVEYAAEIEDLEACKKEFELMLARVELRLNRDLERSEPC